MRSKSRSQVEPSLEDSHVPAIVSPLSSKVPAKRYEKPGTIRHSFQTPSAKLISYARATPRESK